MKTNKDLLKHLKSKPKPELGSVEYDLMLQKKLSVNKPVSQESPAIIILCGPSGSGKSTIKSSLLSENKITNYINVDPDDIRSLLTENGMNFEDEDPKVMAGITNQFNSRMMLYATSNKFNVVFDTTGRNMHAMKEALTLTDGYFKLFAAVYTTWENCLARITARNAKSHGVRKELPLDIAKGIYDGFLKGTLSNYLVKYPIQGKVKSIKLFDNNVPRDTMAELVYDYNNGKVVYSKNFEGFYDLNIRDSNITPIAGTNDALAGKESKKRKSKRKKRKSSRHKKSVKTKEYKESKKRKSKQKLKKRKGSMGRKGT